jgi:hypothetical protein
MRQVSAEDLVEVAAADDEQVVEALAADGADPPFGDRVRPWRPKRRLDHPLAFPQSCSERNGSTDSMNRPVSSRKAKCDAPSMRA